MDKIIFITPFFGNSGSEIALFNLIVRIKGFEVIVISKSKGVLANRLPPHIKFYDYKTFCKRRKKSIFFIELRNKIVRPRISIFDYFLDSILDVNKGLIYVNTITLPEVVNYVKRKRYKFTIHAHELQHMLINLRKVDVFNIVEGADFIFTSSNSCKSVFNTLGRVKGITHNYPGIFLESINPKGNHAELKKTLNISQDSFVIAMSGAIDTNKNPEAFLDIGKILKDRGCNVHLLWIGVLRESGYYYFLRQKALEYNLERNCSWINRLDSEEYYEYLNISDCFALTSKQESFSIAIVEAMALGKPVFSFKSGGPQEIINNDAIGLLIEDHSAHKMALAIEKLMKGEISFNSELAKKRALDFSADKIFENWFSMLKKIYAS